MLSTSVSDQAKKEKMFDDEFGRNSNVTPMKTLIAQEMSKEVGSPNLVAKLMGLDTIPKDQPNSPTQSSHSRDYSCWEQDFEFSERQSHCDDYWCEDYEIWQEPQKKIHTRENSPHEGRPNTNDNVNEKKMALIRQKFMEVKQLATDEKLRESKEFHDALEVLSSNRDLFLKFLQESSSIFSQHGYDLHSVLPPETKRITLLKPSKVLNKKTFGGFGKKTDKDAKNQTLVGKIADEYSLQPTRIVVLKPTSGKSPGQLQEQFFEQPEELEAREVAKEITRKIRESFVGHQKDQTVLSSTYSNGYIGDESSFNRSENEYTVGNLSDSEFMSPNIGRSWDCINQMGSPYSSSSFSRASCSPESSVSREAKKRLSERWAMISSNGPQEHRPIHQSSSTLGDMLDLNKESRGSTSRLLDDLNKEDCVGESPKNLIRSKSLPVSSTVYGARQNVEVSNPETCKTRVSPKQLTKSKSLKSTLREKVSSLFFSKSKKSYKENSDGSQLEDDSDCAHTQVPLPRTDLPGEVFECLSGLDGYLSSQEEKGACLPLEAGFSVARTAMRGNVGENQDQPSPISVLEPPFKEDNRISEFCSNRRGAITSLKSNLIDKSPPIGSIARTLTWNDSCTNVPTPYHLKPPAEEEEHDWLFFIQTILLAGGFDGELQSDSFLARWHSPESPLDPSLRDRYADSKETEAQRSWRRSNKKLVFDFVNAVLFELKGHGSPDKVVEDRLPVLADFVSAQMKEWSSSDNSLAVDIVVRKEVVGKGWVDNLEIELENIGKEIEGELIQELVEEAVIDFTSSWSLYSSSSSSSS